MLFLDCGGRKPDYESPFAHILTPDVLTRQPRCRHTKIKRQLIAAGQPNPHGNKRCFLLFFFFFFCTSEKGFKLPRCLCLWPEYVVGNPERGPLTCGDHAVAVGGAWKAVAARAVVHENWQRGVSRQRRERIAAECLRRHFWPLPSCPMRST